MTKPTAADARATLRTAILDALCQDFGARHLVSPEQTVERIIDTILSQPFSWSVRMLFAQDMRVKLATYAHHAWAGWMEYLFSKSKPHTHGTADGGTTTGELIPEDSVKRWRRQMTTAYSDLPESEQQSDLAEADKIIFIIAGLE